MQLNNYIFFVVLVEILSENSVVHNTRVSISQLQTDLLARNVSKSMQLSHPIEPRHIGHVLSAFMMLRLPFSQVLSSAHQPRSQGFSPPRRWLH